jgi:prepilin-type N-terminal cleavage/methylation domain-containing protein
MRSKVDHQHDVGFTLIEIVVALGIASIVFLAAGLLLNTFNQNSTYVQAMQTRNSLLSSIKSLGSTLSVIQNSANAPENAVLKQCLSGAGCVASAIPTPVSIYQTSIEVTNGTPISPRFYSVNGLPCPPSLTFGNPECPLQVTTGYVFQCPANPPLQMLPPLNCSGPPDFLQISYSVSQATDSTGKLIPLGENKGSLAAFTGVIIVKGPHL